MVNKNLSVVHRESHRNGEKFLWKAARDTHGYAGRDCKQITAGLLPVPLDRLSVKQGSDPMDI